LEKHLAYWKKQLSGKLPVLELPADYPRPLVYSYRGGAKSFSLAAELSQSLKVLSRREGITTSIVLLAAFKMLLYRYTAQEDIIVGTTIANRNRAEIEPLIGFFVNMLPMRTDLGGNPRFRELLKRMKDVALGVYAHQDMPIERLVEDIRPEILRREMSLFNVAFGMQSAWGEEARLNGIKIMPMVPEQEMARVDLALWVTEGIEGVQVRWIYSKDLFGEEAVMRMQGHFETLLSNIVDRPDARLTTLIVSSRAGSRLSHKEQDEDSDIRKLMSIKRKGINLPTEPI
jgi:non-ribosomal peptide synthetase component F